MLDESTSLTNESDLALGLLLAQMPECLPYHVLILACDIEMELMVTPLDLLDSNGILVTKSHSAVFNLL